MGSLGLGWLLVDLIVLRNIRRRLSERRAVRGEKSWDQGRKGS